LEYKNNKKLILDLKIGQIIKYNFLYSNEKEKVGLVIDIKKDNNFYAMIYLLSNNKIEIVPYNIMTFNIL
tara:strand:+ start:867 stop:1076 length:210 start_codon:yes stop_codon:yes gene_type:complete